MSDPTKRVMLVDDALLILDWGSQQLLRAAARAMAKHRAPAGATEAERAALDAAYRAEVFLASVLIEQQMGDRFELMAQPAPPSDD
jgi:hypothetical protein